LLSIVTIAKVFPASLWLVSVGQNTSGSSYSFPGRIRRTGRAPLNSTRPATLPKITVRRPVRPWVAMTMRSISGLRA